MDDLERLETYDYHLPEELIAQAPLPERDASRLLVVRRADQSISHRFITDLPEFLQSGDCLVLNNSRVLPARLYGIRTATGGKWEGLYLSSDSSGNWRLIGQTRGYLQIGETVTIPASTPGETPLVLRMAGREDEGVWIMEPQASGTAVDLLNRYGAMPLPPYVARSATSDDRDRYQTTYATQPGSIAAPTAGLHFTPELLSRCTARGISTAQVTLHVGIGTFRPVNTPNLVDHVMHAEWCELSAETANEMSEVRRRGGRIVCVGTTSLRTLESAYAAVGWRAWSGETKLFVRPPYQFSVVDALLTNFHLPKSTLLMLVSAFAGVDLVRRAYAGAIEKRYRFFSYGDAMLIL